MGEELLLHEAFQNRYKGIYEFQPETPISEVICRLLERKVDIRSLLELLYGDYYDSCSLKLKGPNLLVFFALVMGDYPEIVKMLAEHHHWATKRAKSGYSVEVYPGEWLVVPEPYATRFLDTVLRLG